MLRADIPDHIQDEESSSGIGEASFHPESEIPRPARHGSEARVRKTEECNVEKLTRKDSYKISLWKYAVILFTVAIAAGVVVGTYRLLSNAEQVAFDGAVRADVAEMAFAEHLQMDLYGEKRLGVPGFIPYQINLVFSICRFSSTTKSSKP
jgi:hypothetical protein